MSSECLNRIAEKAVTLEKHADVVLEVTPDETNFDTNVSGIFADVFALIVKKINGLFKLIGVHTGNTKNPHKVTKDQIGLGNVNNTTDTQKPVSTAQAQAIAAVKNLITDFIAELETITLTDDTATAAYIPLTASLVSHLQNLRNNMKWAFGTKSISTDDDRFIRGKLVDILTTEPNSNFFYLYKGSRTLPDTPITAIGAYYFIIRKSATEAVWLAVTEAGDGEYNNKLYIGTMDSATSITWSAVINEQRVCEITYTKSYIDTTFAECKAIAIDDSSILYSGCTYIKGTGIIVRNHTQDYRLIQCTLIVSLNYAINANVTDVLILLGSTIYGNGVHVIPTGILVLSLADSRKTLKAWIEEDSTSGQGRILLHTMSDLAAGEQLSFSINLVIT